VPSITSADVQQRLKELEPWFYEFDLGEYGRTTSELPREVLPIHQTRLEMVDRVVDQHFRDRLEHVRCLDVGCHEGFYTVAMARKGIREVRGIDVRSASLTKARFVADVLGLQNVTFQECDAEDLGGEPFDLCLFLGILYHLENPVLCLRNISRLTSELCILETQVIDEVEGFTEWGARAWTRPYNGVLALIDESGEFYNQNPETGASPMATCPSPKALEFMLRQVGFRRVEIIKPPPGAYEQHNRGKRVVCAAYK
jgi:ubiquinone/menaquinone biosynthesis C-methylase UbiE